MNPTPTPPDRLRYFDCNATTPMSERARDAWIEANDSTGWCNPSSLYPAAGRARQELERCREDLADLIGVEEPERIVFTSGATEANNFIIRHLLADGSTRLAFSSIEHPCVDAAIQVWGEEEGGLEIPVDPATGVIDREVVEGWIREGRVDAVSVMAANNETGVLQPWRELAALCRENGISFHTDAAQWLGKEAIRNSAGDGFDGVDWMTGSAHKFGGGKGVGFLVLPESARETFRGFVGGPQEEGLRAGTENLPGVAAMVAALEEKPDDRLAEVRKRQAAARDSFEEAVGRELGCRVLGGGGPRLWNTSMLLLPHGKNLKWLTRLGQRGICVSTGSACSAGRGNPSRVMMAMGLEFEAMSRVLRISAGWETSGEDWEMLAEALVEIGRELGDSSPPSNAGNPLAPGGGQ